MASFGERLRRERESREITIGEIAEATKIGVRYLNALEHNDFAKLPGGVFNRGYVRAFAQYLGIDPDNMIRAYLAECDHGDASDDSGPAEDSPSVVTRRLAEHLSVDEPHRTRSWTLVAGGLALLVMATGGVWAVYHFGDAWTGPAPTGTQQNVQRAAVSLSLSAPDPQADETPVAAGPDESSDTGVARSERSLEVSSVEVNTVEVSTVEATQPRSAPVERDPRPVPPEPVPETTATPPGPSTDTVEPGLSVPDYGVGTAVVDRQLRGKSDRFEVGAEVWFWTRVLGGENGDSIRHVWLHDGVEVGSVELRVGGPHWRTQSRRSLVGGSAGTWVVEARDARDRVLAREEFQVAGGESGDGFNL